MIAGIRQSFHGVVSAVASGNFPKAPIAIVAIVLRPAMTNVAGIPVRVATRPHMALPAAKPP
jgi:hypothetical protein